MADAEFKIDDRALQKALDLVPRHLHQEMEGAFRRSMASFTRAMDGRFNGTSSPPLHENTGDTLVSRTGNLARTVDYQVTKGSTISELRAVAFVGDANTPYAAIQEYGGVVRGNPWLTIPLPDNKTASGVARYQSAAALKNDPSVNTWIQRSKKGNLIIRAQFPGKPIQNLWVLKRSVNIPERLGFVRTFEDQRGVQIKQVNRAASRALRSATGGAQ